MQQQVSRERYYILHFITSRREKNVRREAFVKGISLQSTSTYIDYSGVAAFFDHHHQTLREAPIEQQQPQAKHEDALFPEERPNFGDSSQSGGIFKGQREGCKGRRYFPRRDRFGDSKETSPFGEFCEDGIFRLTSGGCGYWSVNQDCGYSSALFVCTKGLRLFVCSSTVDFTPLPQTTLST